MEECGYLWTANQFNILTYLLFSGFGWIRMEVCVAERKGESSLVPTISTNLVFHLYPTLTTEDFPKYVRDERYSLKQESDT